MKKLPIIIAVPAIVAIGVISVAMAMRMMTKAKEPMPEFVMPSAFAPGETGVKPLGRFGESTRSNASEDLLSQLESTVDDGGAGDLEALDKELQGL